MNKVKESTIKYISKNQLLLLFIIFNLINVISLELSTIGVITIRGLISNILILLILGSFSLLIKDKHKFKYYIIITFILAILHVINSMYYAFYETYATVSLLKTSTQIVDVGDAVAENVINMPSFLFLIIPIVFIIGYLLLKKKNLLKLTTIYTKKTFSIYMFTIIIISIIYVISLPTNMINKLKSNYNKPYIVENYGLLVYTFNDIITTMIPDKISKKEETKLLKEIDLLVKNNKENLKTNEFTNIYKGKNVIMIHAESIQNIVIGKTYNGVELTPNLNKLVNEGIYFSNYYAPVSQGTSSDAEFMLNTSLLPAKNGTVFMDYYENEYITLLDLLKDKGYNTFSMHGNVGEFWNRDIMHKNLGYNMYYDKEYFEIDEVIGLGLSDRSFFNQAIPKIKDELNKNQPIFTNLITLTNHTPFSYLEHYGEYDLRYYKEDGTSFDYLEGTKMGNYFRSVHYFDTVLGEFISNLDKEGLLEDSIIVLYGDHENLYPIEEYNILYNYDFKTGTILDKDDKNYVKYDVYDDKIAKTIPFVIWDKNKKQETTIDTVMSTIDILPTLGNMLGIVADYKLGIDVVNHDNNVVIFPNSDWLDKDYYYDSHHEIAIPRNKDEIDTKYIDKITKIVNEKMDLSNNILKYDLLRKRVK